jgi:hypothetical protein
VHRWEFRSERKGVNANLVGDYERVGTDIKCIRALLERPKRCSCVLSVPSDDKKDATKSATWVCGTCRSRKVINYHNGGLRREVTVELVTQLNEMLKCKDGVDRTKLHRLVKNLITQATTGADVVDEHGKVIHESTPSLHFNISFSCVTSSTVTSRLSPPLW